MSKPQNASTHRTKTTWKTQFTAQTVCGAHTPDYVNFCYSQLHSHTFSSNSERPSTALRSAAIPSSPRWLYSTSKRVREGMTKISGASSLASPALRPWRLRSSLWSHCASARRA